MYANFRPVASLVACVVFALCLQACAGKDKPTPAEQQQADFEALRTAILQNVEDQERAAKAGVLVEHLAAVMRQASEDQQAFQQQYLSLNRDYTASRADFETFFTDVNNHIEQSQNEAVSVRQQLTALLTADEWHELAKVRKKALKSSLPAI